MAIRARKTAYAGVVMRSRLEADYASWLDQRGWKWEYEPIVFAGPGGQWLPDFRYSAEPESPTWYVEVKPVSHLDCAPEEDHAARIARIDELLSRMSMTWLTKPDATVALQWWNYDRHGIKAMVFGKRLGHWKWAGNIPFTSPQPWPSCICQAASWPPPLNPESAA